MSAIQQAKVKSVLSGDTLILSAIHNPRNERTLSLAYVSAPRLRREGDEVCYPTLATHLLSSVLHNLLSNICSKCANGGAKSLSA